MKIAIDCRVLNKGITGTGRYLMNILTALPDIDHHNEYYLFSVKDIILDKNYYNIVIKNYKLPYKIFSPFWMNKIIPSLLKKYNIDVFVSPNIVLPSSKPSNIKYVTVIHDIIPFIHKEYYSLMYRLYLQYFVPMAIKNADKILTVSECSKQDLSKLFNVPKEKIEVVYNSVSEKFYPLNNDISLSKTNLQLPEKYLLFVGAVERRKNIIGLIKMLDELRRRGYELPLIIVGKQNYGYKEIKNELDKRSYYIKVIGKLTDDELNYIYNKAFLFLYPSYYEGFGIPLVEAMKCGLPVLCSNTSSIPEVVGEAGLVHSADDINGFVEDIITLLTDADKYQLLKNKSINQASKFDKYNNAKKFVSIINNL